MDFKFLEVKDDDLLQDVFHFRYNIIKDTEIFKNYVDDNDFKNFKESDIYDDYSVHFVALDDKNNVCATVRLIYNCPHGYPTENCMTFDTNIFDRKKLGEISRIFIDNKHRNISTTKEIFYNFNKLLYRKMINLGIEYTYGALEPRFIRLLKINKMKYEILAHKQQHGKMGLRHPCVLYTKILGDDNPEFKYALKEKHVK